MTGDLGDWYRVTLRRLSEICRVVASKYTRSKVRKALPADFAYIIDELLNTDPGVKNKENYYNRIITSIIEINRADAFILSLIHIFAAVYDNILLLQLCRWAKEVTKMKNGIHPKYQDAKIICACGEVIETRSTKPEDVYKRQARWQAAAVPARTNSNRPQKGQYSPNGRYCPFLWGRQVFTVLVCYFQPEHDRIAGNGRFCPPSEVFPRGTARGFPCIEDNL